MSGALTRAIWTLVIFAGIYFLPVPSSSLSGDLHSRWPAVAVVTSLLGTAVAGGFLTIKAALTEWRRGERVVQAVVALIIGGVSLLVGLGLLAVVTSPR
jgi:hypothetical protein